MSWQWEPTEKIHYYNNIEVISIRGSKILGDAPRIFLLHVDCVLRTLPGVLPFPSPFVNMLDLLQGRTSLKQLLPLAVHYTHNIMYRCMQTHFTNAYMHPQRQRCMLGWMHT